MSRQKTKAICILFLALMIIGCIFLVWASILEKEPDISNILCNEVLADQAMENADYRSLSMDSSGNVYLFLIARKESASYVIAFDQQFNQIAWYRYPYSSGLFFCVDAQKDTLQFFKGRSGRLQSYTVAGELVATEYTSSDKKGMRLDEDVRKCKLQNGDTIDIKLENGRWFLIYTSSDGEQCILSESAQYS